MIKNMSKLGTVLNKSQQKSIKGGVWGWHYKCRGSEDGFSSMGSTIQFEEADSRCGSAGYTVHPIP